MIFFQDATIEGVAIHKVGNRLIDEGVSFSENLLSIDSNDEIHLMNFFCRPFDPKITNVYNLYHPNGIDLNLVNHVAFDCFNGKTSLMECSKNLARHLYDVSNHPKIKGGEFYVVLFNNVQFEGENRRALGLFKSSNRETYVKVSAGDNVIMEFTEAINTHQLDQAALIIERSGTDDGYEVLLSDIKSIVDLQCWKDSFLELKARNDDFLKTSTFMKITKAFVGEKLDEVFEVETAEKTDLMNRSLTYFKEKDEMDVEEFSEEIFGTKAGDLFTSYLKDFEEEFEVKIGESFGISPVAVKKQQASFKQVIKLDKNFHLYVHGKRELLERGYDENKGMNYYMVYFNNES